MKSYTDLEQSKKLAEILPLESADMCYPPYYIGDEDGDHLYYSKPINEIKSIISRGKNNKDEYIPCWGLAALLDVLSKKYYPIKDHEIDLILDKPKDKWCLLYWDATGMQDGEQTLADNTIDACYEMIIKLHELKML